MSQNNRVMNVGAANRASDQQALADYAATADDRALEVVLEAGPAGVAFKRVVPLIDDGSSRRLLTGQDVSGVGAGKVRLYPAYFQANAFAHQILLSAKSVANIDSPTIANNSSGSARTDLIYAQLSYGDSTQEAVRLKPLDGGSPVSATLTTEIRPKVTVNVVAGVAAGNPLASLPADAGTDRKSAVINFPLGTVTVPNGYSGGNITQSMIVELWPGGFIATNRIRGMQPMSIYSGAANEKVTSAVGSRWGSDQRFFAHFLNLPSTTSIGSASTSPVLDNTIDWRYRLVWGVCGYLGSATRAPLEGKTGGGFTTPTYGSFASSMFTSDGTSLGAVAMTFSYGSGAGNIQVFVYSDGSLRFCRGAGPVDGTNGDLLFVQLFATDQFLAGM